ncbi:MAG TPA: aldose 1-epimerase family protein [Micromonosporaceae bacterium]|nr:aldose 1-epimerase family protein [Micromonosporaceae bacterium]
MAEIDFPCLPSGRQWQIESGSQTAVVVEVGGGLRAYQADGEDVVDGYADDTLCPGSAGQVLQPWPNRIRDGRFTVDGTEYQLSLNEPATHNAIHGLARWVRWNAIDVAPDAITVGCDLAPEPGYPWPLRLRTRWSVGPDGLRADHEATNHGSSAAPFGLGVHPYVYLPGATVDDLELTLPAHSRLLVDGRLLPIGAAKVAGDAYDFTTTRRIGTIELDTAFGEVEHGSDGTSTAVLAAPDGRSRTVWADGGFHWWQVFTGDTLHGERHRRSVAIEPMTCPPDAFRSGRDVVSIEPGETWRGSWGIRPGRVPPAAAAGE